MKKLFPILVVIIICLSFFYKTWTKGLLPVPTDTLIGLYYPWFEKIPFKNFLITDPVRQQIPWRKLVIDDWKKGVIPNWNPYNFSGTPLVANIQAGVWYPLNLLFFIFSFETAWALLIILQPILAALFLYVYLRNKEIEIGIAVFASVAWAFCGFSIAWLTWGTILQTALWLPLMLLAIDKQKLWFFVFAGFFALLAGHAQVALYIFLFSALYGGKKVFWWFIPVGVLTSIQWIPMLQLVLHSARLTQSASWLNEGWFLPWQHLIQFVAPDFFGNPATLNYFGVWNYGEFIGYVGILPLIFALYAFVTQKSFFRVALGIVLLFLLPTPLAKLPYQSHIPILSSLQPTRLMVLVDFCLVVLAALGLQSYLRKFDKKIYGIVLGVAGIIVLLWWFAPGEVSSRNLILPSVLFVASAIILFTRRWKYLFIALVIGLTIFDLFRFGWKFTPFTPREYFFPTTHMVSFLQSQQKPFRIMSLDNRIMPPNVHAYYGIESIEGYDPVYDGRYEEFVAALNRREPNITSPFGFNRIITVSTVDSPLFPLLNATYILSLDKINNPDLELMYEEGQTHVYFYKKALPRIYAVDKVIQKTSNQAIIDTLYSKEFDSRTMAVVEESIAAIASSQGEIQLVRYEDTQLVAKSSFDQDRFVVITNMFDLHWKITIDGLPQKVYRTNYIFMGAIIPKGEHVLKLIR